MADEIVDLRSDTVTRPTPQMREAMANADVGDDVYAEDPTVAALEAEVAELFGHPAALFVPSGSMGNQLCVRLLVAPGEELLCDVEAHVVTYEGAGAAMHGGIQTRTLPGSRGLLDVDAVAAQLRPDANFFVPTRAVAVEQTHNRGGGSVYPIEQLRALRRVTAEQGIALHCDGARIWNAHVATGVQLAEYGAQFDTLSVCLSKGLGAPVGSVVVFRDAGWMPRARGLRRALGGGMRQVGILAAAGRYALRHHLERLADDHARARRIAERIGEVAPGTVTPDWVETNIVTVDLTGHPLDGPTAGRRCRDAGVLVSVFGPRRLRLVTHLDVDDVGAHRAGDVLAEVLAA